MSFLQSFKMAWRSIKGKKGRSILTILSIFIGIAAVMTIVSVMEGMKDYTRKQYASMGSNKITVSIYEWNWDEEGNSKTKDYFPELYKYCQSINHLVSGITPNNQFGATVVYGVKSSANMEYKYDDNWNLISGPPTLYYGSNQFSICNEYELEKGRDITVIDCDEYKQVAVIGSKAAETFFGKADPIGKVVSINSQSFEIVGVYASKSDENTNSNTANRMDNIFVIPYTARRILGGEIQNEYVVKARDSESLSEAITYLGSYVKGLMNNKNGGYNVYSESSWQEYETEYLSMIGMVLGGIAAISLLVGGIGIMNIMLVSVTERTKEIGIRRAIGAQRSTIISQFLIEAGLLCGIGGMVGIAIGTLCSYILGKIMFQIVIYPNLTVTLGTLAFSVGLGIIFGCYPAMKAAKLQPVEALRAD